MALYHSERGSVDYTIVGSPTIVDGVASDFSSSNYLKTPILQLSSVNSFEINLKISADNPDGTYTQIAGNNNTVVFQFGGSIKKLYAYVLDSNGQSALTYTYNHQSEISTIKLVYQNSTYSLYINGNFIESLAKGLPTTDYPFGLGTKMYGNSSGDGFLGSIDLNNTYITVNGQPWFGICPIEVKKHQIMGPVGYTVVGTPTITDGLVSNFSKTSFLRLTSAFPTIKKLEAQFCFKLSDISTTVGLFGTSNNTNFQGLGIIFSGASKKILIYLSSNGTSWDILNGGTLVTAFQTGIVYYLRLIYDGTKYELSSSTDKQNWTTEITVNDSREMFIPSTPFNIGYNAYSSGSAQFMRGQIDTNQTYIKVNGKLWFWQPRETEKIVVNGVQVWQKPS